MTLEEHRNTVTKAANLIESAERAIQGLSITYYDHDDHASICVYINSCQCTLFQIDACSYQRQGISGQPQIAQKGHSRDKATSSALSSRPSSSLSREQHRNAVTNACRQLDMAQGEISALEVSIECYVPEDYEQLERAISSCASALFDFDERAYGEGVQNLRDWYDAEEVHPYPIPKLATRIRVEGHEEEDDED